jgi:hypothetical protein
LHFANKGIARASQSSLGGYPTLSIRQHLAVRMSGMMDEPDKLMAVYCASKHPRGFGKGISMKDVATDNENMLQTVCLTRSGGFEK